MSRLVRHAQNLGVVAAVSSTTQHLGDLRYGVATAQRGRIQPENVINTGANSRLRRFLAKGRVQ